MDSQKSSKTFVYLESTLLNFGVIHQDLRLLCVCIWRLDDLPLCLEHVSSSRFPNKMYMLRCWSSGMPNSSSICRSTPSSKFSTRKGGRPPLLTSTLFSFTSQIWFHRPRRSWAHFIPILGFVDITFSGLLATGPHLLVSSNTPLLWNGQNICK